mmetsp:Transcript_49251/g.137383  ORF Transcript_49251/g.137383 Transcript_49251/m.137383 type:complete len:222 (+) Transcript_49251:194-859(+)
MDSSMKTRSFPPPSGSRGMGSQSCSMISSVGLPSPLTLVMRAFLPLCGSSARAKQTRRKRTPLSSPSSCFGEPPPPGSWRLRFAGAPVAAAGALGEPSTAFSAPAAGAAADGVFAGVRAAAFSAPLAGWASGLPASAARAASPSPLPAPTAPPAPASSSSSSWTSWNRVLPRLIASSFKDLPRSIADSSASISSLRSPPLSRVSAGGRSLPPLMPSWPSGG